MGELLTPPGIVLLRRPVLPVQRALVVLVLLLAVLATACSSADEPRALLPGTPVTLAVVDGTTVTAATTQERVCVQFGGRQEGRTCVPSGPPDGLVLVSSDEAGVIVVVVRAPADAVTVTLRGDGTSRDLTASTTERYFVGIDVPPGTFELIAESEDGDLVSSHELKLQPRSSTVVYTK